MQGGRGDRASKQQRWFPCCHLAKEDAGVTGLILVFYCAVDPFNSFIHKEQPETPSFLCNLQYYNYFDL